MRPRRLAAATAGMIALGASAIAAPPEKPPLGVSRVPWSIVVPEGARPTPQKMALGEKLDALYDLWDRDPVSVRASCVSSNGLRDGPRRTSGPRTDEGAACRAPWISCCSPPRSSSARSSCAPAETVHGVRVASADTARHVVPPSKNGDVVVQLSDGRRRRRSPA